MNILLGKAFKFDITMLTHERYIQFLQYYVLQEAFIQKYIIML